MRPARGVGSAMRNGNCSSSATDKYEQRRMARNPAIGPNGVSPRSSYPRRIPTCKSETNEADRIDVSQTGQPKPYIPTKLPTTVDGRNGHW
ncbi:unnamed protein product [Urochloa humidicola]